MPVQASRHKEIAADELWKKQIKDETSSLKKLGVYEDFNQAVIDKRVKARNRKQRRRRRRGTLRTREIREIILTGEGDVKGTTPKEISGRIGDREIKHGGVNR